MKIGLDAGHTIKGKGYGAVGVVHESVEVRKIHKQVKIFLEQLGHIVVDCTVDVSNQDITDRINKANKQPLDLFVSLHLNAFDTTAHGAEVLTLNGRDMLAARRILSKLEALGYKNRGVKNGTSPRRLGVVNSTKAPAMLVECFFCDNKADVAKYDVMTMAKAIAEGITGQVIGGVAIPNPPPTQIVTPPKEEENKMAIKDIKLNIHGKSATVGGIFQDNTNYIPVRFLESLGYDIDFNTDTKEIIINYIGVDK